MAEIKILYEDEELLVVVKPEGVASQSSVGIEPDMVSMIRSYLYTGGGGQYVGVIHRLDKPVTGIMVYAKTPNSAKWLSRQVSERKMQKVYTVTVCGKLVDKCGKLEHFLWKDPRKNLSAVVNPSEKNKNKEAKLAVLHYTVKDYITIDDREYTQAEVELITGRHHQIRVQFAAIGHPVRGDRRYGQDPGSGAIELKASRLSFFHEGKKQQMCFTLE